MKAHAKPHVKPHSHTKPEPTQEKPVVDVSLLLVQMYRGVMPDVTALSLDDRAKLLMLMAQDSEKEMVLTEREKQRRVMREHLA